MEVDALPPKAKRGRGKKRSAVAHVVMAATEPVPHGEEGEEGGAEESKELPVAVEQKEEKEKRKRGRPRRNPEVTKAKAPLPHTVSSASRGEFRKEINSGMLLYGRSEQIMLEHAQTSELEFREWPEQCESDCWWDSKPFEGAPWVIVYEILRHGSRTRVRGRGFFCCPGCVHAWVKSKFSVEESNRLVNLLEEFIGMVYGPDWLGDEAIPVSDDPECLISKLGTRTLEELREQGGYGGKFPTHPRADVSMRWPPLCMGTMYVARREQVGDSRVNDARSIFHWVINTPEEEFSRTRYVPSADRYGEAEPDPYGDLLDQDSESGAETGEGEEAVDDLMRKLRDADVEGLNPKAAARVIRERERVEAGEDIEESILDTLWEEEDKRLARRGKKAEAPREERREARPPPAKRGRKRGVRGRHKTIHKTADSLSSFLGGASLVKPVAQKK